MIACIAIIRCAGLLVPADERPEWFAEWHAELRYIEQTHHSRALAFCLGAFRDAFWFRRQWHFRWLESPVQCLALLAIGAAGCLLAALPGLSPFRDARGLVAGMTDHPPAGAAFYRRIFEPVPTSRGLIILSIIHAGSNLFDVLRVNAPRPGKKPIIILSRSLWWDHFGGDRNIAGRVLQIDGKDVQIAGVIPDDAWPLPGYADAWMLEDQLPVDHSIVVARAVNSPGLRPLPLRLRDSIATFVLTIVAALLLSPSMTFVTGIRQWLFLLAKIGLILPGLYSIASLAGFCETRLFTVVLSIAVCPGGLLALRWALLDQHRRCPVCLRLLSNPVRFGNASQTFLEWYGTELTCTQGHGVLRVPEVAATGTREWVGLDQLCSK